MCVGLDLTLGVLIETLGEKVGNCLHARRPSPDGVESICRQEETSLLGAYARGQGPVIVLKSLDDQLLKASCRFGRGYVVDRSTGSLLAVLGA